MLYIFLSGIFFPFQGIHWQAKRSFENNKVMVCFKSNSNFDRCVEKCLSDTIFLMEKV